MTHTAQYLLEVQEIAKLLPEDQIESLVGELKALRDRGGRLFLVGLGGSAANCSHAVNDFRKLCGIEAYSPVDNVAELTARANDEGMPFIFSGWLLESNLTDSDALMVLSVGGGKDSVSLALPGAIGVAGAAGCLIFGIVGRDGGQTAKYGNIVVVIPTVNPKHVTPHTEAFQLVILHCLVSHPDLQIRPTKW